MKPTIAFALGCLLLTIPVTGRTCPDLSSYNVVWTSQSDNSADSMPLGGGDVGCNVWVENGDLLLYLSRSGTFDENNSLLKLGRIRISFEGDPFKDGFRQELLLEQGAVAIKGGDVSVKLWVEVFRPIIHIEAESGTKRRVSMAYESWRTEDRQLSTRERHQCFTYSNTTPEQFEVFTRKDSFEAGKSYLKWWHRNRNDELATDRELVQQHLGHVSEEIWDPLQNRIFGGLVSADGMELKGEGEGVYASTPYHSWNYRTKKAVKSQRIDITLFCNTEGYLPSSAELSADIRPSQEVRAKTLRWWADFWKRSHIVIDGGNPGSEAWTIGRNYQLFRYQLACNAYGEWPTKFNGSLFTYDPMYFNPQYEGGATPDFRLWGGGSFTGQNQRLVYWPMLKSGDFDMMKPQFDFYRNALGNACLRTRVYWGHGGASFSEQLENNGLPAGHTYERLWGGTSLPIQPRSDESSTRTLVNLHGDTLKVLDHGWITNTWVGDHYDTQLEFAKMILDYQAYTGEDISAYMPFIDESIRFHDEHSRYWSWKLNGAPLDAEGKLIIYPGSGLETYKLTTNATNTIAGMKSVIEELLELGLGSQEQRAYWTEVAGRLPEISFREKRGHKTISPAKSWSGGAINNELPQLYPVFPYRLYGIGRPGLQVAVDTYRYGADIRSQYANPRTTWHPDAIYTACMGMADEAERLVKMKLCNSSTTRFPTFWGTGDWGPDHNWGGVGCIALQEMLLQEADGKIYLLPAWPGDWDADFLLHASGGTTVQARVRDGKVEVLDVKPASRAADVVVCAAGN